MTHVISVMPAQDGWTVQSRAFDNAMVFRSGGRAEAAARRLADRYARAGEPAEIRIFLRDGSLAGRLDFPARPAPAPARVLEAAE